MTEPRNDPRQGDTGRLESRRAESRRSDARRTETRREPHRSERAIRAERARVESARLDQPREPHRVRLPRFDPEAFGRWSEGTARFMGTAKFIVYMTVFIALWFAWNTLAPRSLRFDPYTFTFLTLLLSLQASYAAPLILLAQNRQADRDRLAMEEDRRRAAMQKADTEYLAREIAALRIALGEVATRDFLRSELNRMTEDLDELAQRRYRAERKEQKRAAKRAVSFIGDPDFDDLSDDAVLDDPIERLDRPHTERRHKKERRAPQGARRATPTQ